MAERAGAAAGNITLRSFATFLLVGGFSTALHYAIMALLYNALGVRLVLASNIGFALSALVNYLLTARLTFRSAQSHRVTAPRFFLVAGTGLALNAMLLTVLAPRLHIAVAQILTTLGVLIWNYSINALWTFRNRAR